MHPQFNSFSKLWTGQNKRISFREQLLNLAKKWILNSRRASLDRLKKFLLRDPTLELYSLYLLKVDCLKA